MSDGEVFFEGPKEDPPVKKVSARQMAERAGWEWRENPVLGDSTDKVQRIFEEIWSGAYALGVENSAKELQAEYVKMVEELENYKREFQNACDDNRRLEKEVDQLTNQHNEESNFHAIRDKEFDERGQLIVDLQNRHANDLVQLHAARLQVAKAVGFPEEWVFVPTT